MSRGFGELRLGAASALPWFLCGRVGACPVCTRGCCRVGKLRQAAPGAAPSAPAEDWEGGCEAVRVPPKDFARRGQSAPLELALMVGGTPEVSPWAVPPSQKAPRVVGCGVFCGCAGGGVGPAAVGSQPASPRQQLLVFKGCLCPHGGSVQYWSGGGVSSSASAQGHVWCRVGNNPAVGPPLLSPALPWV